MNTPILTLPPTMPPVDPLKKKRVLLIDTSERDRELRADVMRKRGMDVDCAADVSEARSWWRADLYDLVLISMEKGHGYRDRLCDDMRKASPPQRIAFFVGKPGYLASAPNEEEEMPEPNHNGHSVAGSIKAALALKLSDPPQRWGILEASRRISAVRSACNALTRAMRDRPAPPRDMEGREAKRTQSLDDLLRQELQ